MVNAKCMIFLPSDLERIRRIFYLKKKKTVVKILEMVKRTELESR
jgi:hypothetical protein